MMMPMRHIWSLAPRRASVAAITKEGEVRMRSLLLIPLCLVAACSGGEGGGGEEKKAEAQAATIEAGQWETSFEVTEHRSADQTEPALKAAVGDRETAALCVAEADKATPPPSCSRARATSASTRTAISGTAGINASLDCTRAGITGQLMLSVDGSYTGTTFEATVQTTTYLPGRGDFASMRKVGGRKIGANCAAAEPTLEKSGKARAEAGKSGRAGPETMPIIPCQRSLFDIPAISPISTAPRCRRCSARRRRRAGAGWSARRVPGRSGRSTSSMNPNASEASMRG
jgi:hypothetical protein